jgi:uncharacterized RDD family membrane protein YckC
VSRKSERVLAETAVAAHPNVVGRLLASPGRRLTAFVVDATLLFVPSVIVAIAAAALTLYLTDRPAFDAIEMIVRDEGRAESPGNAPEQIARLGGLAPLLVRVKADGLPPSVALAVQASDLQQAGQLLADASINFSLGSGGPLKPGWIRVDIEQLVPGAFRGAAVFGTAALYFTWCAAGKRRSTLGKRLMGIEVVKLDGRPLTTWESFERFGGYFAALGTFGIGLLDLWRDPNRRLAHDRLSNTVVVQRGVAAAPALAA